MEIIPGEQARGHEERPGLRDSVRHRLHAAAREAVIVLGDGVQRLGLLVLCGVVVVLTAIPFWLARQQTWT